MADLREQLLELLDDEICVCEYEWIRRPVRYFLGHVVKNIQISWRNLMASCCAEFGSERSAKLLRKWLRPTEIQPVFCAINHDRCEDRAICDRNVNDIIKRSVVKVKRCDRPSDLEVSGHSLRVGAAQDLLIRATTSPRSCAPSAGQIRVQSRGTCGFRNIIFGRTKQTEQSDRHTHA